MPSSKHFRAFVALALAILPASLATAQQTGLLLVAHGATPAWNDRVRAVAREVRWPDGPVAVAFLMGSEAAHEGWSAGLRTLAAGGASGAVVVPVMVNSNGAHVRQIEFYAGLRAELPPSLAQHDHRDDGPVPALRLRVTPALDAAPELGAILLDGWR
ncbi:MAG TPA: CbiX/SirB N-terminal domain-containing protein, partial [Gemmatimonadales bacterium]|nr:CbiX/SirB N-terminal domain-containing protein [Gemmatimonadales bacterium]